MVRPDQELLSLKVGAHDKTSPDIGQALPVGCRVCLCGQNVAPAVVADRENALDRLLPKEGAAD